MEVLLALVVLAIGLYGILDLVAQNRHNSLRAKNRATALELARGKMAELRTVGYDALAALVPPASSDAASTPTRTFESAVSKFQPPYPDQGFFWQTEIEHTESSAEVLNVEVRVFWHPPQHTDSHLFDYSVSVGGLVVKK
jgi:hypothetical protein